MEVKFTWASGFSGKKKRTFTKVQSYIDEQCVTHMSKFVPVALPKYENAGALRASVEIAEPGKIIYTSNFAKHQYYANLNHKNTGNPKATRLWFETMKGEYAQTILRGAIAITKKG